MQEKNIHSGHRKRMRESFLKRDFNSMPEHEILEILLFYAHPRNDTNAVAHKLINAFGSLENVLSAPYEELIKIDGIGENSAVLLNLFSKLAVRYVASIDSEEAYKGDDEIIKELISRFANEAKEKVFVVLFDKRGKMLNITEIASGGIDDASFRPRALLEPIFRCEATKFILAHNHPQGFAVPSAADVATTKRVKDVVAELDTVFEDHIIVSGKDWFSMKNSSKYAEIFKEY
ncbi:MAG: DNA repair protein RadC [Clostridia bacterium]|nr:DNA repair protein RadC [Clostridia bacterium]